MNSSATRQQVDPWLGRPLGKDLKGSSIRGGVSALSAELVNNVLRVASMIVLARWLMPEHFGLVGMVTALTLFAERFKDLGLDVATIQREGITHQQVSTLFWINTGVGLTITLVVVGCAPLIAKFYGEPQLFSIALILATTFFFGGATIQHQALLRRQMRFAALAWITIFSAVAGFVTALVLAWYQFGYWALVWREVVRAGAVAIGAWVLCPWRPGLPRPGPDIYPMVRVGGSVTGFNILHFLSRSVDQILIGRLWGAAALGFYRQGHQLVALPLSVLHLPVDSVALPALSALWAEPARYRNYYREITSLLAFGCMPVMAYLAMYSDPLIVLALGEKWRPAAPMLSLMAIAGFAWPLVSTGGTVMVSSNQTNRYFWLGVANAVTVIIAFSLGVRWGSVGVAAGYAVWTYVMIVPSLWFAFRGTPLKVSDPFTAAARPAAASLVTCGLLFVLSRWLGDVGRLPEIAVSLSCGTVAYLGLSLLLPGGGRQLAAYRSHARAAFSGRAATPATGN